jgi:hypothetical protein
VAYQGFCGHLGIAARVSSPKCPRHVVTSETGPSLTLAFCATQINSVPASSTVTLIDRFGAPSRQTLKLEFIR